MEWRRRKKKLPTASEVSALYALAFPIEGCKSPADLLKLVGIDEKFHEKVTGYNKLIVLSDPLDKQGQNPKAVEFVTACGEDLITYTVVGDLMLHFFLPSERAMKFFEESILKNDTKMFFEKGQFSKELKGLREHLR